MKLYTWEVGVASHSTTGFASTYDTALEKIRELCSLYREIQVEVRSFSIDNPEGICVMSMEVFGA